jgi:hypothetical protein
MAHPFETELEELAAKFARELSHEVTALILRRLGIEKIAPRSLGGGGGGGGGGGRPAAASRAPRASKPKRGAPARAAAKPAAKPSRRTRVTVEERAATLDAVERIVATDQGLSAGEIERRSNLSRATVAAALKALKDEGRLFMGGTKRFARYATSQAAADKASREARGGGAEE